MGIMCDVCVDFHDLLLSCKQRSIVYTVARPFLNLYRSSHAAEFLSRRHVAVRDIVDMMREALREPPSFSKCRNASHVLEIYNLNRRPTPLVAQYADFNV